MRLKRGVPRAGTSELIAPNAELEPKPQSHLPYFSLLQLMLDRGEAPFAAAFGRHVHWGYWNNPKLATGDADDFAVAAERLTQEICAAADIADGMTVLDVGCGFGGTIASLNERFRRMQLTGLNIDPAQIARARAAVTASGDNRIGFVVGDASHLPCGDRSCDRVLAVEAIFHFPDRGKFFSEAHRVLKLGGRLTLSDFVPTAWIWPGPWLNVAARYFGDCDMRYSLRRYRALARATGFRPVVERNVNAHTLPTFAFLQSLRPLMDVYSPRAIGEIRTLHWLSRLGLLRYSILSFEKN